jgi:hypothetical protein
MLKEILVVANPRPVVIKRAPPKIKLLVMGCDEVRVAKTSNAWEIDRNRFPNCSSAFPAPLSVSPERKIRREGRLPTSASAYLEGIVEGRQS